MKILCVADHIDPLVYSNQIKNRYKDVEFVLGAGDLPLEYYSYIVSCLNVPLLFVYGNHNLTLLDFYKGKAAYQHGQAWETNVKLSNSVGATYIEDRSHRVHDTIVMGLGGCMRYNNGDHQFTEFQMFLRMLHLLPRLIWNRLRHGRFLDILLTHAPPRGIHDKSDRCHTGFRVFLTFMRWFRPKYLVHGHIHLYELNETRKTTYHQTTVLNCYDHLVLEIDDV